MNRQARYYGSDESGEHKEKEDFFKSKEKEIQETGNQIIREIFDKEHKYQVIRRDIFVYKKNLNYKINSKELFDYVQETLGKVYGIKLEEINKEENVGQKKKQKDKQRKVIKQYILVRNLTVESQKALCDIWSIIDKKDQISTEKGNEVLVSNFHLTQMGIILLSIIIVILSENRIEEKTLYKSLNKFGLDSTYVCELILDLLKKNYLKKSINSNFLNTFENSQYSLGNRALVEFTSESFNEFAREIYGSDFNEVIENKIKNTLNKTYKNN